MRVYRTVKLFDTNEPDTKKFFEKIQIEAVQLRYNKMLLGVHSKASNIASYAELGSYPLAVDIAVQIIKYWIHMMKADRNSLLHDCYMYQMQQVNSEKCWMLAVKHILCELGFEHIWYQQEVENQNQFIERLKGKIKTVYKEKVKKQMFNDQGRPEGGNKLRTYRTFKDDYGLEPYLMNVKPLPSRNNIAKLRISAHDLHIERGRYHRPQKTPISERRCQFCSEIEDEKHVVLRCPKYSEDRKTLFNTLYLYEGIAFLRMDPDDKFVKIMQCKTKPGGEAFAKFLNQVKGVQGKL